MRPMKGSAGGPVRRGSHPASYVPRRGATRWRRPEVWERFDFAVEGLSRARTGLSVIAISHAFGELSAAAFELADAVDRARRGSRTARAG